MLPLVIAILTHGISLWFNMAQTGGMNLALGKMLSLIMLFVSSAYLLCCLFNKQNIELGIILLPITWLAMLIGQLLPGESLMFSDLPQKLRWHVIFAIPAFIFLCLAFSQAILLLIAENAIRHPVKTRLIRQLPAIDSMDNLLYILISFSFFLISINIFLGILTVSATPEITFSIDHHFVLTILSWLCLLCLLIGRIIAGWRTAVAAKWTISAFVILTLAYFGTRFVTQTFLS